MSFQGSLKPTLFTVDIPDEDLTELKNLIRQGRLPPVTYEGTQSKYGVTREWMKETKDYWLNTFDWRKQEKRINKFPNYLVDIVDDDGRTLKIHFVASLSSDPNAIPIVLLHGWPGSFVEFLDVISLLSASTSPTFNVIVPSFPGFAFSTIPTDREFGIYDAARIIDKLMVGLGYGESGYITQGGDIGSHVSSILGAKYPACKAVHLNFSRFTANPPEGGEDLPITDREREGLNRFKTEFSRAYVFAHSERPSTIGHVLASNPLALLAWIGEKFLTWTDGPLPLDAILEDITLYWLTESFPRDIYTYRNGIDKKEDLYIHKPVGYSWFPKDSMTPKSWVEKFVGDLVFTKWHDKGGHFAALEQPQLLADDVIEFVRQVQSDVFPETKAPTTTSTGLSWIRSFVVRG